MLELEFELEFDLEDKSISLAADTLTTPEILFLILILLLCCPLGCSRVIIANPLGNTRAFNPVLTIYGLKAFDLKLRLSLSSRSG